jgi:hypothetical protein
MCSSHQRKNSQGSVKNLKLLHVILCAVFTLMTLSLSYAEEQDKIGIPFQIGFTEGNTVLNDGKATNELKLAITNITGTSLALNQDYKFTFSFDTQGELENKPWALGMTGQINAVTLKADTNWTVEKKDQGPTPLWILRQRRA